MHIPDGFVSGPINGATALVAVGALAYSLKRVRDDIKDKAYAVPLLATMAAFVFAAQMLNFPIGGGTSGHFLGAVVVAALLGPWAACIVLSIVLLLQCLFFADGGLLALGSNIFNMGIAGGLLMFPIMWCLRSLLPEGRGGYLSSVAVGSWLSVVMASSLCALELAASGTSPLGVALPAMAGTHAVIGIGEALITVAVVSAVAAARPDVLPEWAKVDLVAGAVGRKDKNGWKLAKAGVGLALLLAVFASPFASASPDGLDKFAQDQKFEEKASPEAAAWTGALFPEYKIESIEAEGVSTSLAGLIGVVLVFAFGLGVIRAVEKRC